MRLWSVDILPYLPKSQLLAQWRELNSIFKNKNKHILINYVYKYDKTALYTYSLCVLTEMYSRGYKFNLDNLVDYLKDQYSECYMRGDILDIIDRVDFKSHIICPFEEHNNEYLIINYYNLAEKYMRGQKDFDDATYLRLYNFIKKKTGRSIIKFERRKQNEY